MLAIFLCPSSILSNTNGNFNLIGNPYQSQVDLESLLDNSNPNSEGLNHQYVYIYDPTLGTQGGYATVQLNPLYLTSVPTDSDVNQYLQPNQAFFVQTTGATPSLTFTEDTKFNDVGQTETFSTENTLPDHININLKYADQTLVDGVRVVLDDNYASQVDYFDAVKLWNLDESLSIYSKNNELSIEKRPQPVAIDTTQLHLYNYTQLSYTLDVEFVTEDASNQNIFLVDQYTQNSITITPNQLMAYDFTVNPDIPESVVTDRFLITYESTTLSVDDFNQRGFGLYPNPVSTNNFSIISQKSDNIDDIKQLELYNLQGQLITIFDDSDFHVEQQKLSVRFKQNLTDGVYLLKLISNVFEDHLKLIIKN